MIKPAPPAKVPEVSNIPNIRFCESETYIPEFKPKDKLNSAMGVRLFSTAAGSPNLATGVPPSPNSYISCSCQYIRVFLGICQPAVVLKNLGKFSASATTLAVPDSQVRTEP